MLRCTCQSISVLALLFVLVIAVSFTEAAEPCIKATFRGDASTYNPFLPGWKTGGGTLATGGRYNPNEYTAALQLGLAKQYRCGYGSNAICHAIVQAPNGRAMTVRINDNGPLVSGRVIDLNEKSMQYLSGGTMGRNSGVIRDVTVTLLCGIEGQPLGPLEPRDRELWASRTFDAPYANVGYGASPFANLTPFTGGLSAAPSGVSSGISTDSLYQGSEGSYGATARPSAGTSYPYPESQPPPSSSYAPQSTLRPVSETLLQNSTQLLTSGAFGSSLIVVPSTAALLVQPRQIVRGEQGVVSWTSVGMLPSRPCRVTVVSGGKEVLVGQGNEGSRKIRIGTLSSTGMLTFTMRCTALLGTPFERTAALIVR